VTLGTKTGQQIGRLVSDMRRLPRLLREGITYALCHAACGFTNRTHQAAVSFATSALRLPDIAIAKQTPGLCYRCQASAFSEAAMKSSIRLRVVHDPLASRRGGELTDIALHAVTRTAAIR